MLFLFVSLLGYSQNDFKAPNVTPVPPTVASQLKYLEVPVSNYNGTSQFSIPLYTIKEAEVNLPISLSYYSNGLKVEEEASWVGLGWNLNIGGFIQFIPHTDVQATSIAPYGVDLNPEYEYDYQFNAIQRGCTYQTPQGDPITFDNASDIKYYGYEHPLYMFKFNGYSGKFIITPGDLQIVTLDRSNIKFERLPNPSTGFKATTPDGVEYYFEDSGKSQSSRYNYSTPCSGTVQILSTSTSLTYNLTKIVSPTNKEITFTYSSISSKSLPSLSQWFTYDVYSPNPNSTLYTSTYSLYGEKILTEINSDNVKVKFTSSSRNDIYQGKKLDKIEVFSQFDLVNPVKSITFTTDYFNGNIGFGDFMTQLQALGDCGIEQPENFVTDDLKKKRLKLNSVRFNSDFYYSFQYNTTPLPYKTSLAQDMWGYFNGINNSTLLPNVNNLGYDDQETTTYLEQHPFMGNRKAYETYMKAGMLTKIVQPTKGYTEISYEANTFITPPGSMQTTEVPVVAVDSGEGKDVKIFDVPGLESYARVNIQLSCVGPGYPCSSGDCLGYSNYGAGVTPTQDNRLYVLLEKKNSDGSWSDFRYFDRLSPEFDNYCTFVGYISLPAGSYRLTANFPDSNGNGNPYGGPWASASIYYKDYATTTQENIGGGLRVSSIIDYNSTAEKYSEKHFSYGVGKLITKPDFIYVYDSDVQGVYVTPSDSNCTTVIPGGQFAGCSSGNFNILHKEILYSSSISGYSYNAMGGLVGYGKVTVSYGENNDIGKEEYKYINNYDLIFPYPGMLHGVTGLRKPDNGKLIEKLVYKNRNPEASTQNFDLVFYEKYEYEISAYKKYWNFKPDYHPTTAVCGGEVITSGLADLSRNFIHFYPVVAAKVRLKSITTKNYSSPVSGIPTETVSDKTDYIYNSKHQLISEINTNSRGETVENKYFYPFDLLAGTQSSQMTALISQNRIDIPIKQQSFVAGIKINEQETKYVTDATTGNLLLPKEIYIKKGAGDIDLTTDEDRLITFVFYGTETDGSGEGNVLEYVKEGGTPIAVIWGYNNTLPIAKIEGLSYSNIPSSTITNLKNLSNSSNESGLISALNALRASLPNALVTTYTHYPLIGVSTITDARGYSMKYFYDSTGRLKYVKDDDDHILSENQYNYKY